MPPLQTLPQVRLSAWHFFSLGCLLVIPAFAVIRLSEIVSPYLIPGVTIAISLLTGFFVAADKKKAQMNLWRIPESTLHFLEMVGGWPGSFLAQRRFRHKISKASYQFTFWLIVIVHQAASLDYLNDWKYSAQLISLMVNKPG